jgi:hypothetical protein
MLKSNRFLPFILSISFAVFAIARINETDEHLWVVIYGSAAAISGFAFFEKFHKLTLLTIFSGYIIGLIYILSELYENMMFNPDSGYAINITDLQNLIGLVICLASLLHYIIVAHKSTIKTESANPQLSHSHA